MPIKRRYLAPQLFNYSSLKTGAEAYECSRNRINTKTHRPARVIHHQVIDVYRMASHQGLSAHGNPSQFCVVSIIFRQTFSVVASFLLFSSIFFRYPNVIDIFILPL